MTQPNIMAANPEQRSVKTDPDTFRLSRKQLVAARLVAEGCSSKDVAGELRTTPRTVNRWKSVARFQLEVRRVRELMTMQKAKTQPNQVPQPLFGGGAQLRRRIDPAQHHYPSAHEIDRPPLKLIEQDDREIESLIADLLQCETERLRRAS